MTATAVAGQLTDLEREILRDFGRGVEAIIIAEVQELTRADVRQVLARWCAFDRDRAAAIAASDDPAPAAPPAGGLEAAAAVVTAPTPAATDPVDQPEDEVVDYELPAAEPDVDPDPAGPKPADLDTEPEPQPATLDHGNPQPEGLDRLRVVLFAAPVAEPDPPAAHPAPFHIAATPPDQIEALTAAASQAGRTAGADLERPLRRDQLLAEWGSRYCTCCDWIGIDPHKHPTIPVLVRIVEPAGTP